MILLLAEPPLVSIFLGCSHQRLSKHWCSAPFVQVQPVLPSSHYETLVCSLNFRWGWNLVFTCVSCRERPQWIVQKQPMKTINHGWTNCYAVTAASARLCRGFASSMCETKRRNAWAEPWSKLQKNISNDRSNHWMGHSHACQWLNNTDGSADVLNHGSRKISSGSRHKPFNRCRRMQRSVSWCIHSHLQTSRIVGRQFGVPNWWTDRLRSSQNWGVSYGLGAIDRLISTLIGGYRSYSTNVPKCFGKKWENYTLFLAQ